MPSEINTQESHAIKEKKWPGFTSKKKKKMESQVTKGLSGGKVITKAAAKKKALELKNGKIIHKIKFQRLKFKKKSKPVLHLTDWLKKPGQIGFNAEAMILMKKFGLTRKSTFKIECPPEKKKKKKGGPVFKPMAYQKTVSWLVAPNTPVNRLLCVHRTGSGKTFTIIRILDNYYKDPRPKILIFPAASVQRNFYSELLKFPSRYRTLCNKQLTQSEKDCIQKSVDNPNKMTPQQRSIAKTARKKIEDFLAMKGNLKNAGAPGFLSAPLRAFTYSIAGGKSVLGNGRPRKPIFTRMYDGKNPYSNKIILMDEVHNLIKPQVRTQIQRINIKKLGTRIKSCTNSVVVGMTATPIVDGPEDGKSLLSIIKGAKAASNSEGYVSYFNSMPKTTYPTIIPSPTKFALGRIVPVKLQESGVKLTNSKKAEFGNAEAYLFEQAKITKKGFDFKKEELTVAMKKALLRLMNFCNASAYYTQASRMVSGTKKAPFNKLDNKHAALYATKLYKIAKDIASRNEKALIIIHRAAGFKILVALLNQIVGNMCGKPPSNRCWVSMYDAKDKRHLKTFNSPANLRGTIMKAMVIDAKEFSEGVSFFAVRRVIHVNPAYDYASQKQRNGRALRSCSHNKLPQVDRNVHIDIYVATIEGHKTVDELLITRLLKEETKMQTEMERQFASVAVDQHVLAPLMK